MKARVLSGLAILSLATALTACSDSSESDASADGNSAERTELNVLAASSTRVFNDELKDKAAEFEPPAILLINNAGSSTLVQQLVDGAPGDVLITADEKNMTDAQDAGVVEDPVQLASNVMVMVVPSGNPGGIESVEDISDDNTFVLCDPQVPCGTVSESIIKSKDLDVTADSLEHQVADVLGKVTSGEADAGWVYATDAAAAGDTVEVIDIDGAEEFTNGIFGAVVSDSENADSAQQLLDLLADDFDDIWRDYGFTPED
ncbi:molybdate ABC transporter substrate-binding protein [Corynebacterium ammoniagenes]|uniref:Molybdate-binding protein n=2 Tax=Corynebacterium ammoniagenes TaxID=1697 RepID=A0AAV5G7W0_CORAM|nr:molybdate ABC transporter substrate-binding protein [Corynebacterium ammoniagenes]APT82911.1 molybdate-binding protein [Corynebacterium ammoniagenes DSM 20306]AQS73960.1 molybdate ABC transporter substrate-binding protein [Corynebacterium ammoniagenes]EFG80655.1 molybdate ABC transporter, periplasmic molybdate-binding protein [Corynebacterium ammoniagenes DSM 20306]GJN42832.1 molybdate-binding protein [Corynebacterium ammoniagenes]